MELVLLLQLPVPQQLHVQHHMLKIQMEILHVYVPAQSQLITMEHVYLHVQQDLLLPSRQRMELHQLQQ